MKLLRQWTKEIWRDWLLKSWRTRRRFDGTTENGDGTGKKRRNQMSKNFDSNYTDLDAAFSYSTGVKRVTIQCNRINENRHVHVTSSVYAAAKSITRPRFCTRLSSRVEENCVCVLPILTVIRAYENSEKVFHLIGLYNGWSESNMFFADILTPLMKTNQSLTVWLTD